MAISHETIMDQMIKRIEKAKQFKGEGNEQDMLKHIYHVHGLCELLIESDGGVSDNKVKCHEQVSDSKQMSEQELIQFLEQKSNDSNQVQASDEDGSLFDF